MWQYIQTDELYHHGIIGMKWGVRRFQDKNGSLTSEGEERYNKSLTKLFNKNNEDDDYTISKGLTFFRRMGSNVEDNMDKKYTYTYDYDNDDDNKFYTQFGKKVAQYTIDNDIKLAGKKSIGKAFLNKMLNLNPSEDDLENLDIAYTETLKRSGEQYVEDLFKSPFNPSKHADVLEKNGYEIVSRMLAFQRHEKNDEKLKKRGFRDSDTYLNDVGRSVVDKLLEDGYSGIRDYNDLGSAANVSTPTIIFNPNKTFRKVSEWIED